ncbi:MAG: uroporphyrinogen-III synthase [Gammaproteobacteria bacterium]
MRIRVLPEVHSRSLQDVRVLVTRPAHQAQHLCELIQAHGGQAILFPVLEIAEPDDPAALHEIINHLDDFDIAIFISVNAVTHALSLILAHRPLPLHLRLATVGMRTAKELEQFGLCADIFPSEKFNSEALLDLAEMHDVAGKNIVIFRGEGGREFLADTLKQRGATVVYAQVYRRAKPQTDNGTLMNALEQAKVDIITVTSNEGLCNLFDMAGIQGQQRLRQIPLVVLSERTAILARELDFDHPAQVSKSASDDALLEATVIAAQRGIKKHEP